MQHYPSSLAHFICKGILEKSLKYTSELKLSDRYVYINFVGSTDQRLERLCGWIVDWQEKPGRKFAPVTNRQKCSCSGKPSGLNVCLSVNSAFVSEAMHFCLLDFVSVGKETNSSTDSDHSKLSTGLKRPWRHLEGRLDEEYLMRSDAMFTLHDLSDWRQPVRTLSHHYFLNLDKMKQTTGMKVTNYTKS